MGILESIVVYWVGVIVGIFVITILAFWLCLCRLFRQALFEDSFKKNINFK